MKDMTIKSNFEKDRVIYECENCGETLKTYNEPTEVKQNMCIICPECFYYLKQFPKAVMQLTILLSEYKK